MPCMSEKSLGLCIHTMYSLLYGQSRGTLCLVFLPGVLPSAGNSAVLYLSMMREEPCSTPVYFYLSAVWLLLRLTRSLSNLVMSCKVTCLPPRLGGWSESGIPGISLPGSLLGWMNDTVYTPQPCHTHTHTHLHPLLLLLLLEPTGRPRL